MITINTETHEMHIPDEDRIFGVYGEVHAETKIFRIPRYTLSGIDLSDCNIRVNYMIGETPLQYLVSDIDFDEQYIIFKWTLGSIAEMVNEINFLVEFIRSDVNGEVLFAWHSRLGTGVVYDGMDSEGIPYEELTKDAIESILRNVDRRYEEIMKSIPKDYTQLSESITEITEKYGKNVYTNGDVHVDDLRKTIVLDTPLTSGVTYTLSAIVESTDTDSTKCLIHDGYNSRTIGRGSSRMHLTFVPNGNVTSLTFYASDSYSNSIGDSAKFKKIQIERGAIMTEYESPITAVDKVSRTNIDANVDWIKSVFGKNLIGTKSGVYYPCIITNGMELTISTFDGSTISNPPSIEMYDIDKKKITEFTAIISGNHRTIEYKNDVNIYYLRFSSTPSVALQVEYGNVASSYAPYDENILIPKLYEMSEYIKPIKPWIVENENLLGITDYVKKYGWEIGRLVNGSVDNANTSFVTISDYIDVKYGDVFVFYNTSRTIWISFYDVDKTFINEINVDVTSVYNDYVVENNASYVKFCASKSILDNNSISIRKKTNDVSLLYNNFNQAKSVFCIMGYNTGGWYIGTGTHVPSDLVDTAWKTQESIISRYNPDVIMLCEYWKNFSSGVPSKKLVGKYYRNVDEYNEFSSYWGLCIATNRTVEESVHGISVENTYGNQYLLNYVYFNGKKVALINTHLSSREDDGGKERKEQCSALLDIVKNEEYFIMYGDWNVRGDIPNSEYDETLKLFKDAGYRFAVDGKLETYREYPTSEGGISIDDIITSPNIVLKSIQVDEQKRKNSIFTKYDHSPVVAYFEIF